MYLVGVASVDGFGIGSVATSRSVAGSRVGISSKFFIENNLLLKLLRNYFLGLNNNPKLYKKRLCFKSFCTFFKII